jgi:hypothetical protein
MNFLDQLPITKKEKELIEALGTETPTALYRLIQLAIPTFEDYFGKERTWHLVRFLYPLLPNNNKDIIDNEELLHVRDQIKKLMIK